MMGGSMMGGTVLTREVGWEVTGREPFMRLPAGLYAERVGAINYVLADAGAAKRVLSQNKRIARALYSNPPVHDAAPGAG